MGPGTKEDEGKTEQAEQDAKYNPGQRYADREFGDITKQYHSSTADDTTENANIENLKESEKKAPGANDNKNLNQAESKGSDQNKGMGGASLAAGGVAGLAGRALQFIMGHKKSSGGIALLTTLIILVAFNLASPAAILVAIKEALSRFPMREANIGMSHRLVKISKAKYFGVPECTGGKWKCRHQKGVTPKEIDKFKKAGFTLEDGYKRGGKQFFKSISYVDSDGKKVSITAENFEKAMKDNPLARAHFNKILSSRSIMARSAASLKKLAKFFVNRKNPAGAENDTKNGRLKKLRGYVYDKISFAKLKAGPPVEETDEDGKPVKGAAEANKVGGAAAAAADQLNQDAIDGKQAPENIANPRNLNAGASKLEKLGKTLGKSIKGGLKGLFTGVFTSLDAYCTVYQIVRTVALTAKILVVAQLIKYAMIFLTVADQLKAGDGGGGGVASFVSDILLRPSTEPESAGKTISDSPGWVAITQSGIIDRESMMRFVTGGAVMIFFHKAQKFLSVGGLSPSTCKFVKSGLGQAGLLVGGLVTSLLSIGGGVLAGVLIGVGKGLLMAIALQYAIPYVAQMAAGTVSPDPENDPQGGYGAGNALAAGVSALGGEMTKSNGMRPMTTDLQAYIQRTTMKEQQTMAEADAIENRERGIFSPTNPGSFQNQFALAMLPYVSPIIAGKNLGATIMKGGELLQSALATVPNMFSRTAGAIEGIDPNSVQAYRGDACPDEDIQELNLVATFSCTEVRGPSKLAIGVGKGSDPDAIVQWLADHNYLDAETGEMSDELKEFKEACIDSTTQPITADGLDIEGLDKGGKACTSQDKKYEYFWTYITDESTNDSIDKAMDDKLGFEKAEEAKPKKENKLVL
jgi:hypothetical protein